MVLVQRILKNRFSPVSVNRFLSRLLWSFTTRKYFQMENRYYQFVMEWSLFLRVFLFCIQTDGLILRDRFQTENRFHTKHRKVTVGTAWVIPSGSVVFQRYWGDSIRISGVPAVLGRLNQDQCCSIGIGVIPSGSVVFQQYRGDSIRISGVPAVSGWFHQDQWCSSGIGVISSGSVLFQRSRGDSIRISVVPEVSGWFHQDQDFQGAAVRCNSLAPLGSVVPALSTLH